MSELKNITHTGDGGKNNNNNKKNRFNYSGDTANSVRPKYLEENKYRVKIVSPYYET